MIPTPAFIVTGERFLDDRRDFGTRTKDGHDGDLVLDSRERIEGGSSEDLIGVGIDETISVPYGRKAMVATTAAPPACGVDGTCYYALVGNETWAANRAKPTEIPVTESSKTVTGAARTHMPSNENTRVH